MARVLRSSLGDGTFHVSTVAVDKTPAFLDDVERVTFLRLLGDCVRRFDWTLYAYCLMTTHYHLVIEAPLDRLSRGMHRLNFMYARHFNDRHRRRGRLFADRFASFVIKDEEHFERACEYVFQNPVKAGLCVRPEEWRWSSYGSPF